jgi:bifunctional non-homologous end joining protein LigD
MDDANHWFLRPVFTRSPFIRPCSPIVTAVPPTGPNWLHEVKFDGYRVQIHKDGKDVTLFSKTGNEFTSRYPAVAEAVSRLPSKAVVLDAELTACDAEGSPDFRALVRKRTNFLCVWVFDILFHNGKDLRFLTSVERRQRLEGILLRANNAAVRYSETFPDPIALLSACKAQGLEGIVSKRIDKPYRSGPSKDWIKVKCPQWRENNQWRHDFFARQNER